MYKHKSLYLMHEGMRVCILWRSVKNKFDYYEECNKRGMTKLDEFIEYLKEKKLKYTLKQSYIMDLPFIDCEVYE